MVAMTPTLKLCRVVSVQMDSKKYCSYRKSEKLRGGKYISFKPPNDIGMMMRLGMIRKKKTIQAAATVHFDWTAPPKA